ncbi:Methionine aminopeptidase [Hahella chejuensis KCTC 2396]|uniref:Methionine aminopeptidase n=1 Tax=Hahella chejuensis (strain KCTC 2396) TaxID=349521 RepID=Q2SHV7_HAHCH|nr:M24 family metallopeptidase [Hahella chejuensis]ABC29767.1 Methionine aminopeptidase [Hahella chejuensis KCTC 2396]
MINKLLSRFRARQPKVNDRSFDVVERYASANRDAYQQIQNVSEESIIAESRRVAPIVSDILRSVKELLKRERVTGKDIQSYILERLDELQLYPAMAGYGGFPAAIGVSVNSQLIHHPPTDEVITDGSVVTIELGASSTSAYASQTWTFVKGDASKQRLNICNAALDALSCGIEKVWSSNRVGDISFAIQSAVENAGCHVVREYCGYGMGKNRIQDPQILCFGRPDTGPKVQVGRILNIHVMATEKRAKIEHSSDGWGVSSAQGGLCVGYSAMVLVTENGHEILSDINM